jgi:hypothetical protein
VLSKATYSVEAGRLSVANPIAATIEQNAVFISEETQAMRRKGHMALSRVKVAIPLPFPCQLRTWQFIPASYAFFYDRWLNAASQRLVQAPKAFVSQFRRKGNGNDGDATYLGRALGE